MVTTKANKKELKLNRYLEKYIEDMDDLVLNSGEMSEKKQGKKAGRIANNLEKTVARMEKYGFECPDLATLEGYSALVAMADAHCSGKSCDDSR